VRAPCLVLASSSPRRRELLAALGLKFEVRPAEADESLLPAESPYDAAERIAREKAARVAAELRTDGVVVAADTVVVVAGTALGKPSNRADAARMLRAIQGRRHDVVSGLAVARQGIVVSGRDVTGVVVAPMSEEEIAVYAASGEPDDKAGAYALQGLGGIFIERVDGSPSNVIGLPVRLLARLLREAGVPLLPLVAAGFSSPPPVE
jgi:septum formation protein